MNIFKKVSIKTRILKEYYLFQKYGFSTVVNEKISKSVLKKYLPENPVCIDCGAFDGADSIELNKILGGKVYAFEPVPSNYSRLVNNTVRYENIISLQLALGDKNESMSFFKSNGASSASGSLLEPKDHLIDHPNVTFEKKIEVEVMTLDDWAKSNNIDHVDLLWLDMQGYELRMLKTSKIILPTVKVIHTEVSTKETYLGAGQYTELKEYLNSVGFQLILEAIPENWDMGNVLFVRGDDN